MARYIDGKAFVPFITDERLNNLLKRFAPLVHLGGKLYRIKESHPRNVSFTWDRTLLDQVWGAEEVGRVKTDHYCAYYGFFKPSIAEVLSQMPFEYGDKANAFYIINDFESGTDDEVSIYKYGNGHRATTVFVKIAPQDSAMRISGEGK